MRKAALLIMALFCVSLISFSQDNQLKPGTTIISPSGVKTMSEAGQVTNLPTQTNTYTNSDLTKNIKFNIYGQQVMIDRDQFMAVYQQNLKLNENRFKDLNQIQIGDTVILTALNSSGYRYWIANAQTSGEIHECIWLISAKYIVGNLQTQPASIEFTVDPEQGNWWDNMTSLEKTFFWALLVAILLLIAVAIIWLFSRERTKAERKIAEIQKYEHEKAQAEIAAAALLANEMEKAEIAKYPENHPPVITGGLSKDDNIALHQMCQAYGINPATVNSFERCTFIRDSGPDRQLLKMAVGASPKPVEKDMYVFPGEEVVEITCKINDKVEIYYAKSTCGNLFGTVLMHGQFDVPKGWRKIPISKFVPAPAPNIEANTATSNGSSNGNGNTNGKAKSDTMSITIEVNGKEAIVSHVE